MTQEIQILLLFSGLMFFVACEKNNGDNPGNISNQISIDSLTATALTVKAWDTTTIVCHATGLDLIYAWECDHGNFNGSGTRIKYAAGECCVGINTITCTISNITGQVSKEIKIEITSYFGGGK